MRTKGRKKESGMDSEAQRPREIPGIRRFRSILMTLYFAVLLALAVPFAVSVVELSKLESNL